MKKNNDRYITAILCDDIRQEMGNKYSLMGCYQGELVVPIVPAALPKLCIFASIYTPKDKPFKSLLFRVVQDDDKELARVEMPAEGLIVTGQNHDDTSTKYVLNTAITFAPFSIEKPSMLRFLAVTEEGEIIGPRFLIKVGTAQEPAAHPAAKPKLTKSRATK